MAKIGWQSRLHHRGRHRDRPRHRDALRARGRKGGDAPRSIPPPAEETAHLAGQWRDRDPHRCDRPGEPGAGDPHHGRQVRRAPCGAQHAGGSTASDNTAVEAPLDEFWRRSSSISSAPFSAAASASRRSSNRAAGSVINMSSNVALMGVPGRDCYTAAKGGIAAITRSLAVAYGVQKVRVKRDRPVGDDDRARQGAGRGQHGIAKARRLAPPRPHRAGDIAQCALYLASDESRMVTGQVLPVDSGVTIS